MRCELLALEVTKGRKVLRGRYVLSTPRSTVEQRIRRCDVSNSRYNFSVKPVAAVLSRHSLHHTGSLERPSEDGLAAFRSALMLALFGNFLGLFIESALWLLLGFAGRSDQGMGARRSLWPANLQPGRSSTVKAAIGAPPLCSWCYPGRMGLRRSGASKCNDGVLISTPETGVDSVSVSYALSDLLWHIRPVAHCEPSWPVSLLGAIRKEAPAAAEEQHAAAAKLPMNQHNRHHGDNDFCGLRFTFVDLLQDITKWLLIGLGCAALIKTFVPQEFLLQWGDGLLAFIVMAAIGCRCTSVPRHRHRLQRVIVFGFSPGAVLVFMLVGPATNIATGFGETRAGRRALYSYLGSVVGVGFAFGYLTNASSANLGLASWRNLNAMAMTHSWLGCAAALLALLMLRSMPSRWSRPATAV